MNFTRKIMKAYSYGVLYCGTVVICYDLGTTKRIPIRDRAFEIGKNLSKTLIWPVTAPKTIKNFLT